MAFVMLVAQILVPGAMLKMQVAMGGLVFGPSFPSWYPIRPLSLKLTMHR